MNHKEKNLIKREMYMEKDSITGIIKTKTGKAVAFSMDKKEMFDFCFITTDVYLPQEEVKETEFMVENGLIYGKTSDNFDIAIYYGKNNLSFCYSRHLMTAAYFIGLSNITEYKIEKFHGLMFKGSILKSLFLIDAINTSFKDGKQILEFKDDAKTYRINTENFSFDLSICSPIISSHGISGNVIKNDQVNLYLKFDEEQPVDSFFKHYNKIIELISFMTYRQNVNFDEIYLMDYDEDKQMLLKFAEVRIIGNNDIINKNYYSNITFNDLGESLPNLLRLFYDDKDNKETIMIGFLPKNDKDLLYMNNDKIKAICSALECELKFFNEEGIEKNEKLEELIKIVKSQVKEFRKNDDIMPKNTYNLIFNSINHWSLSLSERVLNMCKEFYECIIRLPFDDTAISEERVKKFVKYRNDITHGRYRVLDMEVGLTALLLSGLVYCNILDRIGIGRTKIIELCEKKLLR